VDEMSQLVARGQAIPGGVPQRLERHLTRALQIAARLGDPELAAALAQTRLRVEEQLRVLQQDRQRAPGEAGLQSAEQALIQAQQMAELGLAAPAVFRARIMAGQAEAYPTAPAATPGSGAGPGAGPQATKCPNCVPPGDQTQYRNGPWPNQTATPGAPATACGECTPVGDAYQHRNGPLPSHTPPAGTNSSPDPQRTPCGDCTPPGNANQEQHQAGPTPSQTSEPGQGPGPGPQATLGPLATPQGNQNQAGPQPSTTPQPGAGPGPQSTSQPAGPSRP
jgi:hypothetical protein